MTDGSVQTLARVLGYAGFSVGMDLGSPQAALAIRQAATDATGTTPAEVLCRAGEAAGLVVRVVRRSVEEAIRSAHPQAIWISLQSDPERLSESIAVVENKGNRARVVRFSEETESSVWNAATLMKTVGARTATEPVEWVVVESAHPLTQFKEDEHAHGHGHDGHHDGHHGDHEHHGIAPWKRLGLLLRAERTDLWVAVVYSAAIGVLTLVVPITTQSLVNTVAFGTVMQPLVVLTVVVLVALGFATLLQCLRAWIVELIQQRVFVRVATDVVYRLLRVKAQAFDKHHGPELVNRFLEVVIVQKAGATLLVDGLSVFMQTLIGMTLLAVYHPWLLVFDAFLLLGIAFVLFAMARGAVRTSIRESRAKYSLVAWLEEIARNLVTFKSSHGSAFALEKTDQLVGEYITERGKHFKILLRQIAGSLTLQAMASAVLLGVGGWLVIERQLTLGQLIAAEIVVGAVVSGFSKFGKQLETFYDLQASVDKLGYLTDLPLEKSGMEALRRTATGAAVELKGVSFGYPNHQLLKSVDWQIGPGARVGLSGKGGGGKSTLLDILYALREPKSGVVQVDGRDYRDLKLGDIRSQVVLIRDNEIFEGTVADNVRLGNFAVSSDEIRDALRQVGVLDVILGFPNGIQTKLQTGGLPLSTSQAIRVLVARAIVAKPRLLLVDEALDIVDDLQINGSMCNTLFDERAPWTLLMATANRALLERCDEWYTLSGGALKRGEDTPVISAY